MSAASDGDAAGSLNGLLVVSAVSVRTSWREFLCCSMSSSGVGLSARKMVAPFLLDDVERRKMSRLARRPRDVTGEGTDVPDDERESRTAFRRNRSATSQRFKF